MMQFLSGLDTFHLWEKVCDLPTSIDDGNIHMAYMQGTKIPQDLDPYLLKAVEEIEAFTGMKAVSIMVNRLEANVQSPVHTDPNPTPDVQRLRFHLPIKTNDGCFWWDEANGFKRFHLGRWNGPAPYTTPHKVLNRGDTPRVHIIVDLEPHSCQRSTAKPLPYVRNPGPDIQYTEDGVPYNIDLKTRNDPAEVTPKQAALISNQSIGDSETVESSSVADPTTSIGDSSERSTASSTGSTPKLPPSSPTPLTNDTSETSSNHLGVPYSPLNTPKSESGSMKPKQPRRSPPKRRKSTTKSDGPA